MSYYNVRFRPDRAKEVLLNGIVPTKPNKPFSEVVQQFSNIVLGEGKPLETVTFLDNLSEFRQFISTGLEQNARIRVLRRFCYDHQTPLVFYMLPGERASRSIGIWGCEIDTKIVPQEYQAVFV